METIFHQGKRYALGDTIEPVPFPAWYEPVLLPGWEEVPVPPLVGRVYGRIYQKHGTMRVLASCARYDDGKVWLHVSVSRRNHDIPTWQSMSEVKDMFIGEDRTAIQVMPPRSKHVNIHPGVLHWWCCVDGMEFLPDFTGGGETI